MFEFMAMSGYIPMYVCMHGFVWLCKYEYIYAYMAIYIVDPI